MIHQKDPFLKLYRFTGWFAFLQAASVIFAIIGYFIWPHVFSDPDIKTIFEGIHNSPAVYFMKLDPIVLIGILLQLPVWLGLWAALKQYDKSIATVALSLGLISTVAILTTRPIIEMFSLSSHYFSTDSIDMQYRYLVAGETLLMQFHGTAWAISIITGGLAAILFALIMKKTQIFQPLTFWTMLLSGIGSLLVLVPVIGIISLLLLGTIVGLAGTILCGIDLLKLANK